MTKHLFLTGRKGVGKSTLIRGLLAAESAPLGGFFTVKHQGGVYLLPAAGEQVFTPENLLFYCGHGGDPRRFDDLGCAALADTAGCRPAGDGRAWPSRGRGRPVSGGRCSVRWTGISPSSASCSRRKVNSSTASPGTRRSRY